MVVQTVTKFVMKVLNYHSPLRDSESVCYVRKYVISEFVIIVKVCRELFRILPQTQKLCCIREFKLSMFVLNEFY